MENSANPVGCMHKAGEIKFTNPQSVIRECDSPCQCQPRNMHPSELFVLGPPLPINQPLNCASFDLLTYVLWDVEDACSSRFECEKDARQSVL